MNSAEVEKVIQEIASTSSKIGKEEIIRKYKDDLMFKTVLKQALDPTISYGIAAIDHERVPSGLDKDFDNVTFAMFKLLANRTFSGNNAREQIASEINDLNVDSANLLRKILLKDLRAGFGASTVNKAIKGLIPTFPYMRCSLPKGAKINEWRWKDGVFSQEKADGMFVNINHYKGGDVTITSRQGKEFPLDDFKPIVQGIQRYFSEGYQYHGELIVSRVTDENVVTLPREVGNGMLNSISQGGKLEPELVIFVYLWDSIPLSSVVTKGKHKEPYWKRFKRIDDSTCNTWEVRTIPTRKVTSFEQAMTHYRYLISQGYEGTIIKNPDGFWKDGTSKDQVKMKMEVDVDLKVVDFEKGKGKNASTFGSIICESSDGELVVSVSGFSDSLRHDIWNNRSSYIDRIITVRANSVMKNSGKAHSLFLPRFVEFREDKVTADSCQSVFDQFEASIK